MDEFMKTITEQAPPITQLEFVETKWEVWSDPIENAKTVLPKFLVLTTERQAFVAECRDPDEARLIAAAPAMAETLLGLQRNLPIVWTGIGRTDYPVGLMDTIEAALKLAGL